MGHNIFCKYAKHRYGSYASWCTNEDVPNKHFGLGGFFGWIGRKICVKEFDFDTDCEYQEKPPRPTAPPPPLRPWKAPKSRTKLTY